MLPDVLFLTHRVPFPPDKGDRIRTYHFARFLERHCRLSVACLADEPVTIAQREGLRDLCARHAVVPLPNRLRWLRALKSVGKGGSISEGAFHEPEMIRVIESWARKTTFQAVIVSASSLAPYLKLPALKGVPQVVDLIDVDSQKWFDYAASAQGWRSWLYRLEGKRLRRLEGEILSSAKAVLLVSRAEGDLLQRTVGPGPIHAVENGVDLEYFRPSDANEVGGCVFVGALDYRPNIEGIVWFCEEIWPAIRQRCPELTLSLVGRRPAREVKQLSMVPGVNVIGSVPDVRPHLARAAIAIAPLRIARGVQNKVLEALAMAKPVVTTSPPLAGIGARPGEHLLRADTAAEWADAINRLNGDPELRRSLGIAGRQYVVDHHDWDVCLRPLLEILELGEIPSGDSSVATNGSGHWPLPEAENRP